MMNLSCPLIIGQNMACFSRDREEGLVIPKRTKVTTEQRCDAVLRMLRKETTARSLEREFG